MEAFLPCEPCVRGGFVRGSGRCAAVRDVRRLHAAAQGRKNRETPENSEKKLNKSLAKEGEL